MKSYYLIILSLVLFLTQTVSLTAQTNRVTNGGFEDVGENGRPTGWTYSGSSVTWSVSTAVPDIPEGTKVLNIDVTSTSGSSRSVNQIITDIVAGETYVFSFSYRVYRAPSNETAGLSYTIGWQNANGDIVGDEYTYRSGTLTYALDFWLPAEIELVAPEGAFQTSISLGATRNIGVYIDDVQVVKSEIVKQAQTITGLAPIEKTVGDADFDLTATASSGLEVSYSTTNTLVATVSGNTVHIVGAGTTTITASQGGDENYNPAQPVSVLLTVNTPVKQNQSITGLDDITKTLGDAPFDLTATASSGLAVSYASSNTSVATVSGNRVTLVGAGTTTITASQYGSDSYNPAPAVTATLTVNPPAKQSQTISGLVALTKTVGDADFDLSAVASSSLPVSYTSSNTAVATVSGSTVHIVGAGETVITASQAGNDVYNAAPDATATLTVNPAAKQPQTITGLAALTKTVGDADFELSAVASSGLPVSYTSSNAAVATVSGSTVHIVGAGETTITASQAGNDVYNAAPDATATLTVNPAAKQPQTISGLVALTKTVGDADFDLSAVASSGLAVSYTSSNAAVATVSGSTVHIVGAGETVITASQAGDDSYHPATPVTAVLTVNNPTGIDGISGGKKALLSVCSAGGNLIVSVKAGSRIDIFTVVGGRLQSLVSAGDETVISGLPKGQVLIVRSGDTVVKTVIH